MFLNLNLLVKPQIIYSQMMSNELKSDTVIKLRSVLLPNKKGLLLSVLDAEYYGMLGENIPFVKLGHQSLLSFLRSIPDVVSLSRFGDGRYLVTATADDNTKHIADMVSKQKDNTEGKASLAQYIKI